MKPLYKILSLLTICCFQLARTQYREAIKIHSHNDYHQTIPFWEAYGHGLQSIEVDVFLKNDELFVTHDEEDIRTDRTVERLYLKPLENALALSLGNENQPLQLLFDLKSDAEPTLKKLSRLLEKYPHLTQRKEITFVISGNRPKPETYPTYPAYIQFDYQNLDNIESPEIWNKVALISLPFQKYSHWNGKGRLTHEDLAKVTTVIAQAHQLGKPFRFWGAPDSETAWKTFVDLGVDFINTDMPYAASQYIRSLKERVYYNPNETMVYKPTFASDKKNGPIKNIILLLGDGNGLSQISATALANGGQLTLTQLKSIGLLKTQSADDFTTDSAAGATAIATGYKTNNRYIGVDSDGKKIQNITKILSDLGFNTGFITTDEITGATSAAFYGHQKDRDLEKELVADLLKSKLTLFVGHGSAKYQKNIFKDHFTLVQHTHELGKSTASKVGLFLEASKDNDTLEHKTPSLAEVTKNGLQFLTTKNKPFFLMIEGAHIDSNGHRNNTAGIITEALDFDGAVMEAIQFADTHKNTLVVITADHETGGFSIPQGQLQHKMIEGDFTSFDHTATMVPLFAYGPHSDVFSGVYDNTEVFHKLLQLVKGQY
ncbi:alkaline phosphatase [Arenibacter sp. GZD96]|uniref:alkaline phosphatase n=1 Tax=Aurantibrevibacter litoralis TaxID=3106030 RepID=UPI002B002ABC|nr:alkaline phosphatase [Arenibacter sp. GZD-96]MEA1784768.1 alkaline phosphatase [Arenibacter sp. GZD-96]